MGSRVEIYIRHREKPISFITWEFTPEQMIAKWKAAVSSYESGETFDTMDGSGSIVSVLLSRIDFVAAEPYMG
jgi:hypothetical protein